MKHAGYVRPAKPCTICGTIMDTVFAVQLDKRIIHVVACTKHHAEMIINGKRLKETK
jgi:hypothetical protein